ncbi:hypothetical protein HPB48_022393 [Haemaphysalis longicornis]|uniref:Uncharacterized protein n=1 Tax=Haemaphysalis longicornis TaxID=44386 RepID=A0A9J6G0Q8_HAELO|nr:hypothetical protein HPB48_022393 [Haemaphysalis longicornis]
MVLGIMGVFLMSTHFAVIKVIAGDVDHWCQQPPDSNVSAIIWRKEFIPVEADGRPSRCRAYYKNQTDFNNTEPTACNEWEYDVSTAGSTIVSVWNLVCHRRVLLVVALAAHNSGRMLSIVAGLIADYLGRAPVIRVVAGLMVISTVASCFVTSYLTYIIIRFVTTGFASVNCLMTAVILFEFTTHDHRPVHLIFAGAMASG